MNEYEEYNRLSDYLINTLGHKYDVNILSRIVNNERTNLHINIYEPGTAILKYTIVIRENDILLSKRLNDNGLQQSIIQKL